MEIKPVDNSSIYDKAGNAATTATTTTAQNLKNVAAPTGTEILKPAAYTSNAPGGTTNPAGAYDLPAVDGDTSTSNCFPVGGNDTDATMVYYNFGTPSQTHTSRTLYVMRSGSGNSGDDTWDIQYSINGGGDWTAIETGLQNPTLGSSVGISISPTLDLSLLQVKVDTHMVTNSEGNACIYDVWLDCEFLINIDIANTPGSVAFGMVYNGNSYWAKGSAPTFPLNDFECNFAVTNNGNTPVNISINSSNFLGGAGWTLGATPGENTIALRAGKVGDEENDMVTLTVTNQTFISSLVVSATKEWELKLEAPTSVTDSAGKTATITLTATAA